MRKSSVMPSYNTETNHLTRMVSPSTETVGQQVQDTLPVHHKSFLEKWQYNIKQVEQKASRNKETTEDFYNIHTCSLPEIRVGSNLAGQNPQTKLWTFMASSHTLAHIIGIIS